MKNADSSAGSQLDRSDFLIELKESCNGFRRLGGDPNFLLYALTGALLAEPPANGIEEINAILVDVINPEQLVALGRDAEKMIVRLRTLSGYNPERDVVLNAALALQNLVDWIKADEIKLLSRPRGHQVETKVWRYPFYAAVWPYLNAVSKAKKDHKLDWLQQTFAVGDTVKVVDEEFVRKSLGTGGLKPKDFMKPSFEISKLSSSGNVDTARAWIARAHEITDTTLRTEVSAATDKFLVWRHKLFNEPRRVKLKFTNADRNYAAQAWDMLRDDFGFAQVPPFAVLLDRCLHSANP